MGKQVAKSKGNTARRSSKRNHGIPSGANKIAGHEFIFGGSKSLYEMNRRFKMLYRWGKRTKYARIFG